MDSPNLRRFSRAQLQSLAKRERVRATGKSEDIIHRLLQKYPKGVPVPEDVENPSASSAPQKRIVLKISCKGKSSVALIPESPRSRADQKGKGKAVSTSVPSTTESLQLLYPDDYPSDSNPEYGAMPLSEIPESEAQPDQPGSFSGEQPVPGHPSAQGHNEAEPMNPGDAQRDTSNPGCQRADEEDEADQAIDDIDYPKGAPNHYMVVDALRKFTPLVNTIPSMETRIAESRCLLQRTESALDKAIPDARELVVTREYLEVFLLAKMKQKPELWDGTAKMAKADRKLRMEWLRAGRKAENEKKWREINALFQEKGHKPLPFEAFASQSDEEVIESLETTPESSRSGSPKRPREESVDRDADGYSDTDSESRRKRACL